MNISEHSTTFIQEMKRRNYSKNTIDNYSSCINFFFSKSQKDHPNLYPHITQFNFKYSITIKQHFIMTTTIHHVGKTITTDYHAEVPTYKQPKVLESYINDEGDKMLILDNGRESLEERYNAIWNPVKGKINLDKKYKGVGLDGRSNWIK